MKKRIVALVLLLMLCLSACGSKEKSADLTVIGAEDLALKIVTPQYALTPESYTENAWIGAEMAANGNTVYYLASDEVSNLLCSLNLASMERRELYRSETLTMQDVAAAQDGRLFLLALSESAEEPCLVICLEKNGTELFCAPVPLESNETVKALEWTDGRLFLLAGSNLIIFDDSGEFKEEKRLDVGGAARMAVTGGGTLVVLQGRESGDTISVWNVEKKTLEPVAAYDLSFTRVSGGSTWDLYLDCRGALFGYRFADETLEKLFSWNALGLNSGAVLELDDGHLVTNAGRGYEQKHPLRILRPREDTGEESSVIRFATTGQFMDSRIRAAIQTWNGEHPECPIEVIDYSVYNTSDDQRPGQLRLATDVASGNGPDIYDFSLEFIDSVPSAPSFARRGLLEDLYPYLDADPELKREDFLGGFLQAMEIGGGLYELTPEFNLVNCFADARVVGDPSQWTYARLHEIMAENERYHYFFDPYVDRMWLLGNILASSDSKLIDIVSEKLDTVHPYAKQAMDSLYEILDTANIAARHDPQIWAIVWPEANAYFSGGKSVEDAMRNIQSRVSLYLAEQG